MSDSADSDTSLDISPDAQLITARQLEIASLGKDFAHFTKDANFCIYFKIAHNKKEVEEDIKKDTFFPDFVHQFFSPSERLFGYKNPILRLFYSPSRLRTYFRFEYEDKLTKAKDGVEADDVMEMLSPVLESIEWTQDLSHFIKEVESKEEIQFKPCGDLIGSFSGPYIKRALLSRAQFEQFEQTGAISAENGAPINSQKTATNGVSSDVDSITSKTYQFFHANVDTKGFDKIQAQMQSLIMWFIESATMVDYTDPRWDFFLVFEKYNPKTDTVEVSTEDRYFFAGYATCYRYYAYPDKIRPRISQMLLLPPYRRNGVGTAFLDAIYKHYIPNSTTLDITVEDPDEEFIAMRDFLDCKNCLILPHFQPDELKRGWSQEMAKEAQETLKLCQRQSRKVYEILRLKFTDTSNEEEYTKYRLDIKNRLNIPQQRLKMDCDKVLKKGHDLPEEMRIQRDNQKLVMAQLDENYQELVKQYQHTINKLNNMRNRFRT